MSLPRACRRTRSALPLLLSNDLPVRADRAAREHLAACPACQRELRHWLDLRAAWRDATGSRRAPAGVIAPDPEFFAALQRDVRARVAVAGQPAPRRSVRWVAAAVLVVAAAGVLGVVGPWRSRSAEHSLDALLSGPALRDSRPFVYDPQGSTRPVAETFFGLRGRQRVDRAVAEVLDEALSQPPQDR